ncbi:DUF3761 domain-containing protein [Streptomyces sp. NPDC127190]|uniref:DUF3761 domain-containing protein n=1 Tax=unclassified Streptomyces TaxID=2593676 RepID=UPI00363F8A8D
MKLTGEPDRPEGPGGVSRLRPGPAETTTPRSKTHVVPLDGARPFKPNHPTYAVEGWIEPPPRIRSTSKGGPFCALALPPQPWPSPSRASSSAHRPRPRRRCRPPTPPTTASTTPPGVCGWTHGKKPSDKYETAKCKDASLSYSRHSQGTCSHHHGVRYWLK